MASYLTGFTHLEIQLDEIISATNNFEDSKVIGVGGFGKVYKGELSRPEGKIMAAFKRLDPKHGQGLPEFFSEIKMLSCYKHENLISLLGFCKEGDEMILVYEFASRGSLDRIIDDATLTWTQRLNICLDAAKGLSFLHEPNGSQQRILHRDIKAANILLDENLNAKVSDLGLSKISPANQKYTYLVTNPVGTPGYCDPLYMQWYQLTKESDVYSFGVVLFEVLCGRLCFESSGHELKVFVPFWKKCYEQDKLDEIIFPDLMQQMEPRSVKTFVDIAYQCLQISHEQRPTISVVVEKLETALESQELQDLMRWGYDEYREILEAAYPPLNCTTVKELKAIFSKGFTVNGGKTLLSINDKGLVSEKIYIEACLHPSEIKRGSLEHPYEYKNERFPGGRCYSYRQKSRACVRAQFLKPRITYSVNLVFRFELKIQDFISILYKINGERKLFLVYDTFRREDGWFVAPLYQFTSDLRTADLEIIFAELLYTLQVAGIEFQPLEEKVSRKMQVEDYQDLEYQDIIKAASQSLFYKSLEELKVLLSIGVYLNNFKTWFSINENGDHSEMISIADCLIPNGDCASQYEYKCDSRFPAGNYDTRSREFKVHIKTQYLSPIITYTVNLVLRERYTHMKQLYVTLKYKLNGETKTSTVDLATKAQDGGYYIAELYKFTSVGRVADLEIMFFNHLCDRYVEGILFQPLEKVEHEQVLEDGKLSNDSLQWTLKEDGYTNILKWFHINKGQVWYSVDKNGKKCLMLSARGIIRSDQLSFKSQPESRFREVAVTTSSNFIIYKKFIKSNLVSPDTTYAVYLIYGLSEDQSASESPLEMVHCTARNCAYPYIYLFNPPDTPIVGEKLDHNTHNSLNRPKLNPVPQQRSDGSMEVLVREFQTETTAKRIYMHLTLWHPYMMALSGLMVHGVEIRPI